MKGGFDMPYNNRYPTREQVQAIQAQYPVGTRIRLYSMNDPQAVPSGTLGTVVYVDDMGQLVMKWDNGRSLSLIPGVDNFDIVQRPAPTRNKGEAR